jgi:hypothetical protein
MQGNAVRETVDLSAFPDLVVVLLGFKVRGLRGIAATLNIGRGLTALRRNPPEGMLLDERFLFGWNHIGIRQYWRDFESLERFTRDPLHAGWWRDFLRDTHGCGFWHETYSTSRGMEAIYIDMPRRVGFGTFAPIRHPVGPFMSSRDRLQARSAA